MFHDITDRVQLIHLFIRTLMTERQVLAAMYIEGLQRDSDVLQPDTLIGIQRQIFVTVGISCSFYIAHARLTLEF